MVDKQLKRQKHNRTVKHQRMHTMAPTREILQTLVLLVSVVDGRSTLARTEPTNPESEDAENTKPMVAVVPHADCIPTHGHCGQEPEHAENRALARNCSAGACHRQVAYSQMVIIPDAIAGLPAELRSEFSEIVLLVTRSCMYQTSWSPVLPSMSNQLAREVTCMMPGSISHVAMRSRDTARRGQRDHKRQP